MTTDQGGVANMSVTMQWIVHGRVWHFVETAAVDDSSASPFSPSPFIVHTQYIKWSTEKHFLPNFIWFFFLPMSVGRSKRTSTDFLFVNIFHYLIEFQRVYIPAKGMRPSDDLQQLWQVAWSTCIDVSSSCFKTEPRFQVINIRKVTQGKHLNHNI